MAKRGDNIHKRKDGRWEGRYSNGYKPDGTVKYSSVYARSYAECKEKLKLAISNNNIILPQKHDLLFSSMLFKWFNSNQIRLKGSTEAKYIYMIEKHIIPKLGGIKVSQLNSDIVNSFLEEQISRGGLKNEEKLAPSYVKTMAVIIESTINLAVMEGYCEPFKTPINKPIIPKKELNILSKELETKLIEILLMEKSKVAIGILLALLTGLRIGEVCALRWCDVDFENDILHIRHTVSRITSPITSKKTILIIDTPKTHSSLRIVPVPSILKKALYELLQKSTSEFVISDSYSFVSTRTFDYRYRQFLKKSNIQPFSFHTLRHTYATRCAENGMDAKTLSKILGHSSSNTSLNIYVHPSLETARLHVEQIYCSA